MVGIHDLDVMAGLDGAGAHLAGAARPQPHALRPSPCILRPMPLMFEHDIGDVLEDARHRGDSCSTPSICTAVIAAPCSEERRNAAQRVAERQPEAALERFGDGGGDALGIIAMLDGELLRLDQGLPVLLNYHGSDLMTKARDIGCRSRR